MNKDQERKKKPPPSFSGYSMANVKPGGLDDVGEERTRRIGGFQPSFEPVSLANFEPPMMGGETQFAGSTKQTGAHVSRGSNVISHTANAFSWKLSNVPTLPEYHPLERTAVFVPNSSPSDVAIRISDVLRERSIEATYDNDKAKVKCVTPEGVDFRVRLYRGRGKFSHGIIVEVQRRFGASNTFHSDTMAILDAAEGKVPPPPPLSSSMPLVSDSEDEQPVDGTSSLAMVSKMLSHPGFDTHALALEMLSSLTDSKKMGTGTARAVSTELLRLDNGNDVGAKVLSLVIDKKGDDDMFKLRTMAMTALANAVHSVKGNVPEILREQLRPVLIEELRTAEKFPRIAVQAARIIEHFLPQDQETSGLHEALETALEVGTARNASLQRHAQRCLDKIY